MLKDTQIQFDFEAVKYHNTTEEDNETVEVFKKFNLAANLSVLEVFEAYPDRSFTPFEVHDLLIKSGSKMELTSCRRAISDLEDLGKLENTREKVMERKGRNNFKWKFLSK